MIMKKIVVIGSGVMGSGIAGQIANSGFKVSLLDIIPNNTEDRNILSKQAIVKLRASLEERVNFISPGNIEDNLEEIKSADWIIEVIIEKLEFKQNLYQKLEKFCKAEAIISSNTSTIPLKSLINGMSDNFKAHFLITHFFNPPRYMPLLELVISNFTTGTVVKKITEFLDVHLGKTIVRSNDTPGFIANRIGCYWLEMGLSTAIEMGISIEEADGLMGKPLGIPSTAIFGLYDLIGIDVMHLISNSLASSLNTKDDFLQVNKAWPLITKMIADGFVGRKGKGGFYRLTSDVNGNKSKEVMNLQTGEYHPVESYSVPEMKIVELMERSQYFARVICKTLSYAASLIPEVSDNLNDIDQAMKLGYNWQYGPFELIDLIGPAYFRKKLEEQNIQIPKIISQIGNKNFYKQGQYFTGKNYMKIPREDGIILLKDFKTKAICSNASVSIWDIGQEIAAIELTSKMAILEHDVFNLVLRFYDKHISNFKGIILANDQSNFSVGGNLKFMLEMAEAENYQAIDDYLKLGQLIMAKLKYSPIPVVSALKGMALGGGCEMLLHSAGVVSHVEANVGLVESGVGIIPGWGGCKELIMRAATPEDKILAFKNILFGVVSSSAHKLDKILNLNNFQLVMNSNRVLESSKRLCLEMASSYQKPFLKISNNVDVDWEEVVLELKLTNYNQVIAKELLSIFELNNVSEGDLFAKEREIFIKLLHNHATRDRIKHMLKTGKKLAN